MIIGEELACHRMSQKVSEEEVMEIEGVPRGDNLVKIDGWGYADSGFTYDNNMVSFVGERYKIGKLELPYFTAWCVDVLGVDFSEPAVPRKIQIPSPANISEKFLKELNHYGIQFSIEDTCRVFHGHGHALQDIYAVRYGVLEKVPDIVVYPNNHNEVETIIQICNTHNVVIIPFGGGTSVSGAVNCPEEEPRTILSLDTSSMDKIISIDKRNLTAQIEAGITGKNLEIKLATKGFTVGHEPDSYEFSTLGGWVSTRASGMKKNVYGNIEDILVGVKMVTPVGVIEKYCQAPRVSIGPDVHQMVLGSEGSFGVVTEATLKIRPLPACKRYGSLLFPDFETGFAFVEKVTREGCKPASIRLIDNEQFLFGQSLKAQETFGERMSKIAKIFYLTKLCQFDLKKICLVTLLYEGDFESVDLKEKKVLNIASICGGISTGGANGERGYILTFVIAYIRDFGLDYKCVAESFETSCPWDKTMSLCRNVKNRLGLECRRRKIVHFLVSCRVTQTYDAGAVIYFYFAFNYTNITEDPVALYGELEHLARQEIMSSGGSLSHHHGVGKIRQIFLPQAMSKAGLSSFLALKKHFDPKNIFGSRNLYQESKL
eukprot:TRINITY_DN5543_c0_g1_i3.p1 TRINITY_DN5543_c0_g1~~TRINITY_DN5543_c0_g1_i3.p1  ORF type:complete len:602 (-),score=91.67 TRINITY_DN5543_c0_g1_i3:177-1982(-)